MGPREVENKGRVLRRSQMLTVFACWVVVAALFCQTWVMAGARREEAERQALGVRSPVAPKPRNRAASDAGPPA
jgi:hypothetical protein